MKKYLAFIVVCIPHFAFAGSFSINSSDAAEIQKYGKFCIKDFTSPAELSPLETYFEKTKGHKVYLTCNFSEGNPSLEINYRT